MTVGDTSSRLGKFSTPDMQIQAPLLHRCNRKKTRNNNFPVHLPCDISVSNTRCHDPMGDDVTAILGRRLCREARIEGFRTSLLTTTLAGDLFALVAFSHSQVLRPSTCRCKRLVALAKPTLGGEATPL